MFVARLCIRIENLVTRLCHASVPGPTRLADPNRVRGARPYTGTLYLLYQTWLCPSLITVSTYHIQKLQNQTTTVVVFIVSYTYSSKAHLHIQNYTLHLHDQREEPTVMNPYSYAGLAECGRSLSPSSVPTRIEKPVLSFTLSGKHM